MLHPIDCSLFPFSLGVPDARRLEGGVTLKHNTLVKTLLACFHIPCRPSPKNSWMTALHISFYYFCRWSCLVSKRVGDELHSMDVKPPFLHASPSQTAHLILSRGSWTYWDLWTQVCKSKLSFMCAQLIPSIISENKLIQDALGPSEDFFPSKGLQGAMKTGEKRESGRPCVLIGTKVWRNSRR